MAATDLRALMPLLVMFIAPIIVMLVIAFYRNHRLTVALVLLALVSAFASLFGVSADQVAPRQVGILLVIDPYALFFMGLIFAATFVVVLLSYNYLEKLADNREEYYLLLLLASLGAAVLAASAHFATVFLGLELLSISLYGLIAYSRTNRFGIEAGIKYLLLAAAASAFLLFGMALVYADTGLLELAGIAAKITSVAGPAGPLLPVGLAMLIVGFGFKLAVVPFHLWTPDVYQGAPAPVTAFIASVSKGAVFALLLRFFTAVAPTGNLMVAFGLIAIASMFAGNFLALLQSNVKRLLAYSSIAHLGYVLVAFLASGELAAPAVVFYLLSYIVTTLGAFGVVTVLFGDDREATSLDDYRGLAWRQPWLASIFTAMLMSLAGIPLTAGFVGKFYVVAAGVGSALWLLVFVLVINSAISLYYYLRIVVAMYALPEGQVSATGLAAHPALSLLGGVALAVLAILLIWIGVYPAPWMEIVQNAVTQI